MDDRLKLAVPPDMPNVKIAKQRCQEATPSLQAAKLKDHAAVNAGFISLNTVGISSETVGWMGTARM